MKGGPIPPGSFKIRKDDFNARSRAFRYRPDPDSSSWIKIKNQAYSKAAGRHEQFTRYRRLAL